MNSKYLQLDSAMQSYINNVNIEFKMIEQNLKNLNPLKILELGYAKVERNGEQISNIKSVSINDKLNIYFVDGKIKVNVEDVEWWIMRKILPV